MFGENQREHFTGKKLLTVQHGSGNVTVWSCFALSGPEQLPIIEATMNPLLQQKVLEDNLRPSVRRLKLNTKWTLQHDRCPKHSSKFAKECLGEKKRVLKWPKLTHPKSKMLRGDLKEAV